jgi:hypothetical protein
MIRFNTSFDWIEWKWRTVEDKHYNTVDEYFTHHFRIIYVR